MKVGFRISLCVEMAKIEIPTKEEATIEAKVLTMKLLIRPGDFTLGEVLRLQELLIAEGVLD